MRINLALKQDIETEHKGEALNWTCSTWSKMTLSSSEEIFGYVHKYWEMKGSVFQDRMAGLYRDAHRWMDEESDPDILAAELSKVATKITEMHNLNEIRAMLEPDKHLLMDISSTPLEYGVQEKDKTYRVEDFMGLSAVSVIFKALVPIWGMYTSLVGPSVTSDRKEMKALDLIKHAPIMESEPVKKLDRYCQAWLDHNTRSNSAIVVGIALYDIPYYFLSLAIVRRIPPIQLDAGENFIKKIYNFLKQRTDELQKGPRFRKTKDSDDPEKESIPEQYRISQKVPDYIPSSAEVYAENTERVLLDILGEVTPEEMASVISIRNELMERSRFNISDFFYPILGVTINKVIPYKICSYMKRRAIISVVAVSQFVLRKHDLHNIADLLIANRTEKDLNVVKIGGYLISPLDRELEKELKQLYMYSSKPTRSGKTIYAGLKMIDSTIEYINRYDWDIEPEKLHNLRNDLARMLLLKKTNPISQ